MAVQARETEIKYEATAGAPLPSFDVLPQVARTRQAASEQLDAEYFDTADLRLMKAGITLRRRQGGHDAGWHLKLPAGPHTRREIRLPLGRSRVRVPDHLARLVKVHTRGEELRPVARISTARRRQLLLDSAGRSLAEVASDDVTAQTLGDATRVSQWHEVEVELTGGSPDVLTAADKLLRRGGLNRSGQSAKLARALGFPPLAERRPPGGSASRRPGAAGLPRSAGRDADGARPDGQGERGRRGASDADHGPQAAQHAAGLLAILRRCGERARWPTSCAGSARYWARRGTRRFLPVTWPTMSASCPRSWWSARSRPGYAATSRGLVPMPQAGVLAALDSARYFALLDQLDKLMAEPPWTDLAARPASDTLPAAVRQAYGATSRRMKQARRAPAGEQRDVALAPGAQGGQARPLRRRGGRARLSARRPSGSPGR